MGVGYRLMGGRRSWMWLEWGGCGRGGDQTVTHEGVVGVWGPHGKAHEA